MRLFKRGPVWYAQVYENGIRIQRSTRCHDKKAAEVVAREFERAAADPDHAAAHSATLTDALDLLIATRTEQAKAGKRSPETVNFYRPKCGHWRRILDGDNFPLRSLRPRHVDDFITKRRGEGACENTISKELVALRSALKLAKRAGFWTGDTAEICPVNFAPEYKPRERALTRAELKLLLGQLVPDRAARVAFIVATSACWRETERARRSDPGDGLSQIAIHGTKRSTREREVPIVTDEQRSLLAYALEHGEGEGDTLFRPWTSVRGHLIAACKRAGIERCSPNDLRRTFGNWLRAAGAASEDIAPAMGHIDTRMVETVYGRLSTEDLGAKIRRSTQSAQTPDAIAAKLAVLDLVTILGWCSAATAAPVQQSPAISPESTERSEEKAPWFPDKLVPRDGVEPPTRGFSSLVDLWPRPKKRADRAAGAAPVQQPRAGVA